MTRGPGRRGKRLLTLLILGWAATLVQAEEILDYRASLVAGADGTLLVEERIDYDFGDLHRHGIYRDIPITVPPPGAGGGP